MSRRPLLGVVHPETGEVTACPQCAHREDVIVQLEKENRLHKAKITKLERDIETDARNDPLWSEAEAVFDWWRLACWHPGVAFTAEALAQGKPRLKERGPIGLLKAVTGAAYDPASKPGRNGRERRYDSWELITRSAEKCDSLAERVPGEEGDENAWRIWLLQQVLSNFRE